MYYIQKEYGCGFYKWCIKGSPVFSTRRVKGMFETDDKASAEMVMKHLSILLPHASFEIVAKS